MPHSLRDFAPSEVFDTGIPLDEPDLRDETDVEALVNRMVEDAIQWREEHLDPDLETATDYYHARSFGDEQEGRSKVVATDVRDVVQAVMPSLMRIFFGAEDVVEFKPRGPEDVAVTKQQTDYANYVVTEDNPGFLTVYSAFKDALVRKMGIVKAWYEEEVHVEGAEYSGLDMEQVEALENDPSVEIEVLEQDPLTGLFDVAIIREVDDGRIRIEAVPPEEFIFSPGARSKDDARLIGQVQEIPAGKLVAMGVPREMVDAAKGQSGRGRVDMESLSAARRIDEGERLLRDDVQDDSTLPVRFAEVYVEIDEDDDGIPELRRIQLVGKEIFTDEVVDQVPFAIFAVDPEPHTMVGLSLADFVMDIQRIKSAIMRGLLDSLVLTLNPSTEVVEGEVNMKDMLNPEVGRIIRVKRPGMVREISSSFVGQAALPVLQYMDSVKEDRTGISKAAAGLDADALQSSTKAAVAATISAAQQRTEMFARILAETGFTDLMKIVLRLIVQHQDRQRMVRLRNEWVAVDPRQWDADKDVVINIALGTGLVDEKLQRLGDIATKQEQLLMQGSPLGSMARYRNTLARITELAGFRNSEEFWPKFGPEEEAAMAQAQAQAPPQPSEIEVAREIEMAKIQARAQEKQMELQVKLAELELEREKVARDLGIKEAEVDRKSRSDMTDAAIAQAKVELEAGTKSIDALQKLSQTRLGENA